VPIKKKQSAIVVQAMKKIIKALGKPVYLLSDRGTEFVAKIMKSYLQSIGVKLIHTHGDGKASVIERFHSTLLSRLGRYWTHKNNFNYTKVLPQLLKSYNNTVHSTIKLAPNQVTPETEHIAWKNTFSRYLKQKPAKPVFKPGDKVFIYMLRSPYAKGYLPKFKSEEVFTVAKVNPTNPPTYTLEESEQGKTDPADDLLHGVFYKEELSRYIDV